MKWRMNKFTNRDKVIHIVFIHTQNKPYRHTESFYCVRLKFYYYYISLFLQMCHVPHNQTNENDIDKIQSNKKLLIIGEAPKHCICSIDSKGKNKIHMVFLSNRAQHAKCTRSI